MGLFKRLSQWGLSKKNEAETTKRKQAILRRCHFEIMEERRVLSADPVIAGITYLEGDAGQDITPDYFEVTFEGGADTTQLTQFTIIGDQDLSGSLTDGDMFFDVDSNLPGTGGHHGFTFDAANSVGVTASDVNSIAIGADGLSLTVNLDNFEAGDVFAFTIDVDEVERFRIDKIASGVEFEGSFFQAQFVDQNYTFEEMNVSTNALIEDGFVQSQQEGIFYDSYDQLFDEAGSLVNASLSLSLDNETGQADRTAGSIDAYQLNPKPITISGKVYHDENLNCEFDADESGISNVEIQLQRLNAAGDYETVATTLTDANGNYEFGEDLGLMPGEYQLVEIQPDGFLDVGAEAGAVEGTTSGTVLDNGSQQNVISSINVPLGGTAATDYDFKEVRPASIAGNVWHDQNDDGVINNGEQGIANVLIQITRVGAKDGVTADPFANTEPIFVRTDANGAYEVDLLPPGIYEVIEINNYPPGNDPLAAYVDGKDSTGNIRGDTVGSKSDDRFNQVELCAGDDGVEYNFGELKPASLSGYVSVGTPGEAKLDPSDPDFEAIAGVEIQLYDANGNLAGTTTTDSNGLYEFNGLNPGIYSIVEVQPNGYLDGGDVVGNINGNIEGDKTLNDRFQNITLSSGDQGVRYDFCEVIPAEICGTVWHDSNDDGVIEAGEDRIGGVVIELFDDRGNKIAETRTDAQGRYCFDELYPGKYVVQETQPTGFADGKDSLGQVGGIDVGEITNDSFCVNLEPGDAGVNYNFGEIKLASISGSVHADADGDKSTFDPGKGDKALEGVELVLLNDAGQEIARTTTDANGDYLFDGLRPGTYSVREIGPDGYIDGIESAGLVDGQSVGNVADDFLSGIVLSSGSDGVNYDFCEHIPAELCGTVYHDRNDNGVQDAGEEGIANTRIVLYDVDGNVVAETLTNAEGAYCFTNLMAGEYCVKEFQPDGFVDGKDAVGSVGADNVGTQTNDEFCNVVLVGGDQGTEYNFGELKLAQIRGNVHLDADGNCVFNRDGGDEPLANVMLELLNADGEVIATTMTNAKGNYAFNNILPGEYSIREKQPEGLFNAGEKAGDGNGLATENLITGIVVESGQKLTQYNFCENEPAEIHGRVWQDGPAFETEDGKVPEGYRNQRDGLFQQNTDTPIEGVRMQLYYYLDPAKADALEPRPVTLGEVMGEFYQHMGTDDPSAPVWVETMANGEYWFMGLQAGNYIVLEVQPEGFVDANDIPGSTTGLAFNSTGAVSGAAGPLQIFSTNQLMDSVVNIRVNAGGVSVDNDFTEVRVEMVLPPPQTPGVPPRTPDPVTFGNPLTPRPGLAGLPGLAGSRPSSFTTFVGTSSALNTQGQVGNQVAAPYTWHLSVVNGGTPRAVSEVLDQGNAIWKQAGYLSSTDWQRFDMTEATWSFTTTRADGDISEIDRQLRFGMIDGIPLAGDFDGDGIDEVAVFKDGYWLIDINRNGRWDEADLLAKLGDADDRPVVGDWDGDGKDDIGIYGPMWEMDVEAIARDPGLPNPENSPYTKPKNVPPVDQDSTNGARVMKLTSYGRQRADVIDHVFGTGEKDDIPVTGDWNGNGIRSIGTFNNGIWHLDVNGDGEFDFNDASAHFGQAGDIPLVGDFNGDGVEEIAVYRAGSWYIDSNANRELDATDKNFEMGGAGDKPVVGDWDGDGVDEPGLYRPARAANY